MSKLVLFSIGTQADWDRNINLQLGKNYFEHIVQEVYGKTYQKIIHYTDIEILKTFDEECDIAIRYDNCYHPINLEFLVQNKINVHLNKLLSNNFNVMFYVPTEPFSKLDLRTISKHFNICKNLFYVNCNPLIHSINNMDISVGYIDYFSAWCYSGNFVHRSQVSWKKPQKDFLCLNLSMRPSKQFLLDNLKENNLYNNGYISDQHNTLDGIDRDRSMQGKYLKHPNFYTIKPYTEAVYFEIVNEDAYGVNIDDNYIHNSEKTFRSIYNKLPFLIYGKQHQLKYLRSLGYKTFSKIFDESYDNIQDPFERGHAIVNECKRFCNLTTKEKQSAIESVKDIVAHNFDILSDTKKTGQVFLNPINTTD